MYAQLVDPRPVRGGGSEVSGMSCGEVSELAELWVPPEPHRAGKGKSYLVTWTLVGRVLYMDFVVDWLSGCEL